jgi:soluble lytic murein transglycosylase-like protein
VIKRRESVLLKSIEEETRKRTLAVGFFTTVATVVTWILWPNSASASGRKGREAMSNGAVKELAERWHSAFPHVPVSVIMAVAWIETQFNPRAINDTDGDAARGNAWGLMQVTGTTAVAIAPHLKASSNSDVASAMQAYVGPKSLVINPSLGVLFGTYHLDSLLGTFNNDAALAATAYKYGAGGVRKMGTQKALTTERAKRFREALAMFQEGVS